MDFRSHTPTGTDWKSIFVREQSPSQAHHTRFRRTRVAQSLGADPATLTGRTSARDPSTAAMDDVESFRRIHVQPYNGNFLKTLFEIGENLRTLVTDMSAIYNDENELTDEAAFADRYTDIIKDFEVLRNSSILPLSEIDGKTKHISSINQRVMRQWVRRTAQLLVQLRRSFPIQPSVRQAIDPIIHWLHKRPGWPSAYKSTPLVSNNNWEKSPHKRRMFDHYHDIVGSSSRTRGPSSLIRDWTTQTFPRIDHRGTICHFGLDRRMHEMYVQSGCFDESRWDDVGGKYYR